MKALTAYERQNVGKYILKVLQDLGGSASKQKIKEKIVADDENPLTYENVFIPVISRSGSSYIPFLFDFNFGLKELLACGYIETYNRTTDISLTERGRKIDYNSYPDEDDTNKIKAFWEQVRNKNEQKKKVQKHQSIDELDEISEGEKTEDDLVDEETLQAKLLDLIKQFSPKKFESFSRNLFSKMGIVFDDKIGVQFSRDHGIDGLGIFESDEFRTNKVVIQCKRFTNCCVGEPEIDKFRGVIAKYSADYGIFITTSYFSEDAKKAAMQSDKIITLIDGQRLVNLIIKYELGVKQVPVPYYNIDKYYLEQD